MSDVFFIISSASVVIITILVSILLIKLIRSIDEVNETLTTAKAISQKIAHVVNIVTTFGGIFSPMAGAAKKIIKKRKTSKG
ncbi:MAG: hypothetical protein ACOCXT_03745 [Candidatus Dojkabacteria bacterium]